MANVEVSYAAAKQQVIIAVEVSLPCTIELAIQQSGILQQFPEIDLTRQDVGIFARKADLASLVEEGDRIEIYRPLIIDPKEARRLRVQRKR